jgi:hypothetical protein
MQRRNLKDEKCSERELWREGEGHRIIPIHAVYPKCARIISLFSVMNL